MGNAGTKMAKMAVAPKNIAIGSLITSVLLAALLYVNGSAQQCPISAAAYEELLGQLAQNAGELGDARAELAQNAGELGEARAELASLRSTTSATLACVRRQDLLAKGSTRVDSWLHPHKQIRSHMYHCQSSKQRHHATHRMSASILLHHRVYPVLQNCQHDRDIIRQTKPGQIFGYKVEQLLSIMA